jgi:hypothetical protein
VIVFRAKGLTKVEEEREGRGREEGVGERK